MLDLSSSLAARAQLTPQQLAILESEMNKRRKSVVVAYLLLLFFGGAGAHRFYLGSTKVAVIQLVCLIVGVLTAAVFIGFIPLAVTGIISLVDLFTTQKMTTQANDAIERQILQALPASVPA